MPLSTDHDTSPSLQCPSLTALVVAHNEADQLDACLEGLGFCGKIVVVLDRCTDASKDIAHRHGATLVEGSWPIEGPRRHAGIEACTTPWILEVDADERVSPALAQEITTFLTTLPEDSPITFCQVPFDNYIGQKLVRYGWGAYIGVGARRTLFKKGCKQWGSQRVHPKITFTGQEGPRFVEPMVHYVDRHVSDLVARLNRYSTARAEDLVATGALRRETLGHNVRRVFSRFYKCFIHAKGYREGAYGFLVALCAGLYPLLSYLKALEMLDEKSQKP